LDAIDQVKTFQVEMPAALSENGERDANIDFNYAELEKQVMRSSKDQGGGPGPESGTN
jgi:hypothetical protein